MLHEILYFVGLMVLLLAICWGLWLVVMTIHHGLQDQTFEVRFPRIIPWSVAGRARTTRAQVELEHAKRDLFDAKHARLQREIVFNDLEEEHVRRLMSGEIDMSYKGLPKGDDDGSNRASDPDQDGAARTHTPG